MRKLIWTLVILVVVGVFGGRAWYLHKQAVAEKDVVKIGAVLPLTGPISVMGKEIRNSLELAEKNINQNGGINGRPVKLIVEDGKYTPKDSINALNKIMGLYNVVGMLSFGNTPTAQLVPLIEEKKMPLIAFGTGASDVPKMSDWIFRAWIPVELQAHVMAKYTTEVLGLKKIAILAINDQSGNDGIKIFGEYLKTYGGELTAIERFNTDTMDTRAQILKLMASKPDGIFITGFGPSYISSINRLKEYKFAGYILTEISMVASNQMDQIHNIDKVIFLETMFDIRKNQGKTAEYVKQYQETYHDNPTIVGAFAYEALMLFREAAQNTENGKDLRDGFKKIREYPSIVGNITYQKDGEIFFPLIVATADEHKNITILDDTIGLSFQKE